MFCTTTKRLRNINTVFEQCTVMDTILRSNPSL